MHPDAKSIRLETERQCFPAAPWRIDTFIPLSVRLQSPRRSEPGFITWSLCVGPRIRSKRKGKRELNAVPTPVNKHRLKLSQALFKLIYKKEKKKKSNAVKAPLLVLISAFEPIELPEGTISKAACI